MIISTYKVYTAKTHDGNTIIARRISASGWAWGVAGRHGQIISPEIPEEHLKNFSMIVQGSVKEGWGSETIYDVSEEDGKCGVEEKPM